MERFRSKSCREGRNVQMENSFHYSHINGTSQNNTRSKQSPQGMVRSYSVTHHHLAHKNYVMGSHDKTKVKKSKSNASATSTSWPSLCDGEMQRKKRVAAYKVYAVEGRAKGSIRKSFRWIKETCSNAVYGWW